MNRLRWRRTQGQAAVRGAVEVFGGLDVVLNNAENGQSRQFEEMPTDDFRKLVEANFFGTVLTRAALPVMRTQRRGRSPRSAGALLGRGRLPTMRRSRLSAASPTPCAPSHSRLSTISLS
jgi:NAD(P)-dependent dehydrogenase (short-subunit alcohol dehydrogenase family)